jgi:hypothetical protein
MDGDQMKRNMGYTIYQNKTGDLDQMHKAMCGFDEDEEYEI